MPEEEVQPEATPEAVSTPVDSVKAAVEVAMKEQGITADNWPVEPVVPQGATEVEPELEAKPGEAPDPSVTKEPETSPSPEEAAPKAVKPAADTVPTEYFGMDLSEIPSEKRVEIFDRFKEQDRYIQQVQRKVAELEKQPPQVEPEPKVVEPPSDDDIMKTAGISPDDEMYDVKKEMLLPVVRQQLQLQQQMQQFAEAREVEAFESHWTTTLDQLEAEHGKLPISREELIDIALESNIYDPVDAYARVHLSGRKTLAAEVEKFKAEAKATVAKPSTQRPRSTDATPAEKPEMLDPKAAAKKAAEKLGFDWGEALSNIQG